MKLSKRLGKTKTLIGSLAVLVLAASLAWPIANRSNFQKRSSTINPPVWGVKADAYPKTIEIPELNHPELYKELYAKEIPKIPFYPALEDNNCAAYAVMAAKEFGKTYYWRASWNMEDGNKIVTKVSSIEHLVELAKNGTLEGG